MRSPFRSNMWCENIKNDNQLTSHEFLMSVSEPNGIFVRLSEINEMIKEGVLTVDFDKLEDRIYRETVIK